MVGHEGGSSPSGTKGGSSPSGTKGDEASHEGGIQSYDAGLMEAKFERRNME